MKSIKPNYYDKFICAADRCPCTCCQQWDIYVDDETQEKWATLKVPAQCTAPIRSLQACVKKDLISYNRGRQCKLMTDRGLCSMVLAYGEESIPHTCHVFPREQLTWADRTEYALSPECPEVLRLLWEEPAFQLVSEETDEMAGAMEDREKLLSTPQQAIQLRDQLLELMQNPDYAEADTAELLTVCLVILEEAWQRASREGAKKANEANEAEKAAEMTAVSNLPDSGEIIRTVCEAHSAGNHLDSLIERNELLMDSLYEYQDQGRYLDFIDPVMELAARWQERLETVEAETGEAETGLEPVQAVSAAVSGIKALEPQLRSLIAEEIYASLLPADCGGGQQGTSDAILRHMIIKLEWLIMVCSNIRQCLLLRQMDLADGRECGTADLSEIAVYITRIMGFTDDDIVEYMEEEFEDAVWPIAYAMLLM